MVRVIFRGFSDCDVKVRQSHVLRLVFVSIEKEQKSNFLGKPPNYERIVCEIVADFGGFVTVPENGNIWKQMEPQTSHYHIMLTNSPATHQKSPLHKDHCGHSLGIQCKFVANLFEIVTDKLCSARFCRITINRAKIEVD
jgi:hypothetical protein